MVEADTNLRTVGCRVEKLTRCTDRGRHTNGPRSVGNSLMYKLGKRFDVSPSPEQFTSKTCCRCLHPCGPWTDVEALRDDIEVLEPEAGGSVSLAPVRNWLAGRPSPVSNTRSLTVSVGSMMLKKINPGYVFRRWYFLPCVKFMSSFSFNGTCRNRRCYLLFYRVMR